MEKKYYIKEFSETFGISTATLRYYEMVLTLTLFPEPLLHRMALRTLS